MKRRIALTILTCAHWPSTHSQSATDITKLLRTGGCALLIRHAETEPGIGDPPNFQLSDCSTQRNLSKAGREHSRRIGEWFKSRQLTPRAVQSSAWCRCRDTAALAFLNHTVLPALNSTFNNDNMPDRQTRSLRMLLSVMPAGEFEVWVTHQVNITALTGEFTAMGEALIVHASGTVLARTTFS